MTESIDVLIVGAGPTGLLLAGDLAAAGVSVTVLERRPAQENNLTRAFAVHARTLEVLDARGLADELLARGTRVGELQFLRRLRIGLGMLPSRYPFVLITPQYEVERLLEHRALASGALIRRGVEMQDLRQDGDGVDVLTTTGPVRARYVVGTDGVRSSVRRALGSPFPGRTVARSVMLADVRLAQQPSDVITADADGETFGFVAPFGDGWYRVIAWSRARQLPDDAPVELEEVREAFSQALGTDYGMHDARWLSRFHSDERQVPRYRVGRVFLAGDAAHVHSPAGGQGMNTGLQDAANLGWKLAAELQGWARPGLLDSYDDERHPVGRLVLRVSGGMLRVVLSPRRRLAVLGTLAAAAVRVPAVARRAALTVSGIGIAYPRPRGGHPLVGRRADDVELIGGARLAEVLRDGRFVLVAPASDDVRDRPTDTAHLRVVEPLDTTHATALIRPDGYVAWAADRPQMADVRNAIADWIASPFRREVRTATAPQAPR
jgi:2-polyprenyl-6-methoxyphenol hydroxylase-like FAD-dependent oxidoreductase